MSAEMDTRQITIDRITENTQKIPGLMTRCPITGGYCSHHNKIVQKKIKRHKEGKVMLFMVMHYSRITDTIYKWLFKDMLREEGIRFIFSSDPDDKKSDDHRSDDGCCDGVCCDNACSDNSNTTCTAECMSCGSLKHIEKSMPTGITDNTLEQVFDLNGTPVSLVRADDFSSNSHIICESVCAKMQESDVVIVDLSYENPNVFYEFGLAAALEKKILPICYSYKYYEEEKDGKDNTADSDTRKKYIRRFRWKEFLFKYFSVNRMESKKDKKAYMPDDKEFDYFPYTQSLSDKSGETVGMILKELLNHSLETLDNLMLYDLQGFQYVDPKNSIHIKTCIENYGKISKKISRQMKSPGDRIGLMYLNDKLKEVNKYFRESPVDYSFGDICRLAINQGVHDIEDNNRIPSSSGEAERILKNYLFNCTRKMKLEYPVYVDYLSQRIFSGLDEVYHPEKRSKSDFTFFDIALANASACNTAFLDFRRTSLQAMFWLGVFHGCGRFAVPLRYEQTKSEEINDPQPVDIAGLWNAYYFSENSEEFARRIRKVLENIYDKKGQMKYSMKRLLLSHTGIFTDKENLGFHKQLEFDTFYKKKFWENMLKDGDIDIYPTPYDMENYCRISNWEYDGFCFILKYITGLNHIHTLEYQNVVLLQREYEDMEEAKRNKKLQERISKSCIVMGDRNVNCFTKALMAPYEGKLYRFVKCDCCEKEHCVKEPLCPHKSLSENFEENSSTTEVKILSNSYRGFCSSNNETGKFYIKYFPTVESLKKMDSDNDNMEMIIYGHLVIIRKGESHFVLLEGASGPGTLALAEVLSSGGPTGDTSCLFLEIQEELLKFYMGKLKNMLGFCEGGQAQPEESFHKYADSLHYYIGCCLCNYFLPAMRDSDFDTLKERGRSFLSHFNSSGSGSILSILTSILNNWIEWMKNCSCTEAIVEVKVKSTYYKDKRQDLRKLDKITLIRDTVRTV